MVTSFCSFFFFFCFNYKINKIFCLNISKYFFKIFQFPMDVKIIIIKERGGGSTTFLGKIEYCTSLLLIHRKWQTEKEMQKLTFSTQIKRSSSKFRVFIVSSSPLPSWEISIYHGSFTKSCPPLYRRVPLLPTVPILADDSNFTVRKQKQKIKRKRMSARLTISSLPLSLSQNLQTCHSIIISG